MAISLAQVNTPTRQNVVGDRWEVIIDFTGDASYPTGGYPLPVGLSEVDFVDVGLVPVAAAGLASFNYSTGKLQFFTSLTGTEVTNATNVTTVTGRLLVRGKGFPNQPFVV